MNRRIELIVQNGVSTRW